MVADSSLPGRGSVCVLMSRAAERSFSLMCSALLEGDISALTRLVLPACSRSIRRTAHAHDGAHLAGADDHEAHVEHGDVVVSEKLSNNRKGGFPASAQNVGTHGRQLQLRPFGAFQNLRGRI